LIPEEGEEEAFTENFEFMGYEDTNFLLNSIFFVFLLVIHPVLLFVLYIVQLIFKIKSDSRLLRTLRYDYILRVVMQGYLELCIAAMIQT